MICRVCNGSGSFVAIQPNFIRKIDRALKWFGCPSCNGLGTITVEAPAKIRMGNRINKKLMKLNKQIDWDEKELTSFKA